MKLNQSRRGFLLAVLAGVCLLPSISRAAYINVGTGNDTSYLVLESPNLGTQTYAVNYTYDMNQPQDGYFLLSQVAQATTSTLTMDIINYGSGTPNYILNSITFNGTTEINASSSPYTPYWAQWVSGGEAGYPSESPVASGTWSFGSGLSDPYRLIVPGSTDALYFSDGNTAPTVAPIPETSSAMLSIIGSLVIFKRRRRA
jgi:hypothetical protein